MKLPNAYHELVKNRNGGELFLNAIISHDQPFSWHTPRKAYEVRELSGISQANPYESIIGKTKLAIEEWEGPEGLVALEGEGHWWLCLDYRQCGPTGEPTVVHSENGSESPSGNCEEFVVAKNFADFIANLHLDYGGDYILGVKGLDRDTIKQRVNQLDCKPHANAHPNLQMMEFKAFRSTYSDSPATITLGQGIDPSSPEATAHRQKLLGIEQDEIAVPVNIHFEEARSFLQQIIDTIGAGTRVLHSPIDGPQLS